MAGKNRVVTLLFLSLSCFITNTVLRFTVFFFDKVLINGLVEKLIKQERSYRKQITHQLRTQYADGNYDNPVTLKSRLTVSQGHWKRNHWVDHTRLTIRQVIGRWVISWPWNVRQRSLEVIEISAIRKLGCGFLFAFYNNYGRICSHLWDIQCQRMASPWKPG